MKQKLLTLALSLLAMTTMNAGSLYDIALKDIDGHDTTLADHKDKVLLIVNVASECGATPQYKGLEALYDQYKGEGLVVLGFPCNQFGGQEPGTEAEIKTFCTTTYGVEFPMYSKIDVNGDNRHALYTALAGEGSPEAGDIGWNFTKFLVGRDGSIVGRFNTPVQPDADELVSAVKTALASDSH